MVNIFAAYKGNHIGKELAAPVSQEEINHEIEHLLSEHNHGKKKEGKSENGDIVNIDFEGFLDGVSFEGGKGEHYDLELGSHSFIPGFEDQLVGHEAGENVEVKVTFPTNYQASELAGKETIFKCKIHEVKTKAKPELNDEFAAHFGYKNVDELKAAIKNNLEIVHQNDAKNKYLERLLRHLVMTSSLEPTMEQITKSKERIIEYYSSAVSQYGMTLDSYLQAIGMDKAKFEESILKEAENTAKTDMIAQYIGEKESLLPTEEEINQKVQLFKNTYHLPDDKIDEFLAGRKEEITSDILREKVAKLLLENND